jgi:CBS domain-containing membrane protein
VAFEQEVEMPKRTPISQVMTRRPQTADVGSSLDQIRETLVKEGFHHMPVVKSGSLVGIISARDLVRGYRDAEEARGATIQEEQTVATTMQTDLITMRPDESVDRAIDLLGDGAVHSVLIVDEEERLVGIVTNIDLLEYLFT